MKIPSSFKLGAHTWRVRYKKMVDLFGYCDCDRHLICISTFVRDRPTTEEERITTFIHEMGHAVLHTMGKEDNEELVAATEQLIYQAIKTQRFPRATTKQ